MQFYDIFFYGKMIADKVRTGAYARALRQCVTPDSVVLDMGTGVGTWALLACQLGARKVYAVDANDVIEIARQMAIGNGYQNRIEFIQQMSTRLTLPEPADIIVYEMHGVLPMFEQNLPSIVDARRRHLAPGGTMIPQSETLWAALVEAPEAYRSHMSPWDENPFGLDMRAALPVMTHQWRKAQKRIKPEQLLVEPQCWASLDYDTLENSNVSGTATWTAARAGTAHGFAAWFDTSLVQGVSLSNAPGTPEMIFGNGFFPWPEPVAISKGDVISVAIQADLVGENYLWRWNSRVMDGGCQERVKAHFTQTNLSGAILSPTRLRRRASDHVPALNEEGQIDEFILARIDGQLSLSDIACQVSARFPARFAEWEDALTRIGELSDKYGL